MNKCLNAIIYPAINILILKYIFISSLSFLPMSLAMAQDKEIILIGASIGKSWRFDELPKRINLNQVKTEYIGIFDTFDKSAAVEEILARDNKPDVVIIKECSIFFPGDIGNYKKLTKNWIDKLTNNNIKTVIATAPPFSEPDSIIYRTKKYIKKILGKPDRYKQITDYNDWLRVYAKKNNINLLDLEAILRNSVENRYLNPKYDIGDHVHLNTEAYKELDKNIETILIEIINEN